MKVVRVKVTGKRDIPIDQDERNEMLSILARVLSTYKFTSHHISIGNEVVEDEKIEEKVINPVHDMGAEDEPYAPGVYEAYVEFLKSQY